MQGKKNYFRKGIVGSVIILLTAIVIPSTIAVAESIGEIDSKYMDSEYPYLVDSEEQVASPQEPTEIIEERTENEVVLDNHDGTFTKKIYQEPIYTEAENSGKLEEVQTNLIIEDGVIQPDNVTIPTTFLPKMEKGLYQIVGDGSEKISFSFKGASGVAKESKEQTSEKNQLIADSSGEVIEDSSAANSQMHTQETINDQEEKQEKIYGEEVSIVTEDRDVEISENEALYKNVLPEIDFRQMVFNQSVKEDLIIHSVNDYHSYYFEIETSLNPKVEDTGEVTFRTKDNKFIYEIPRPTMTDSNFDEQLGSGISNESNYFEVIPLTKNLYQLVLRVDSDWIQSTERVFPIYIDPSITYNKLQDANARQANGGTNYSGASLWRPQLKAHTLWVGKYQDTQANQAYFKTDMSKINQATIQKAQFKVYNVWHSYDNLSNELSLNAVNQNWDPKKITWNNKPSHTYITKTNVKKAQWATFDVTTLVQEWSTGKRVNYGISLTTKNQDDHWKQVVAAENSTNIPYFEITYAYNKPVKPTVKGIAHDNQKTGHLEISWPKINGATSYQIILSSGKENLAFPVGNVTSFSTKGKGIFPTDKEIAEGISRYHTDGKGTDLALDPREFYENVDAEGAANSLKGISGYDVRIAAVYPGGISPQSDYVRTYLPIGAPKGPIAKAYSNLTEENSGYVQLSWEEVPLADSYEVLVFNGKDYQTFDVGNTLTWTTQGKGIWPTNEEIAVGKYQLHTDGKGSELAKDPRPVYKNAGTQYAAKTNYWFRVRGYRKDNKHVKSNDSAAATPSIPDSQADKLGMTDFWTSIPVRGGQINAVNGNLLVTEEDFNLEGRGISIGLTRTFNSFNQEMGIFGKGWSSTFEERLIDNVQKNEIYWMEADNKQHVFKKKEAAYQAPPGLFSEIKKEADGTYTKTEEDKSKTIYSKTGKLVKEIDKNQNTTNYTYDAADRLIKIKDASNREVILNYSKDGSLVESIQLPESKTLSFRYDSEGKLIESKTARGKTYGYGYNEQKQLISLYEPKHTDEHPQETKYVYEDNKIKEIIDPVQKKTQIAYNTTEHVTTVTNEKGKKTAYYYSKAGNPEKTIEDIEGLKLTTSYQYESNNLMKEINPKGQAETYTYDGEGNILTFTDAYGTETYAYNKNNDIVTETDTENRKTTTTYDGADALSETINDANTSSFTMYDRYGNILKESASLGTGENMVKNSGFESGNTEEWYLSQDKTRAKGSMSIDTKERAPGSLSGKYAIKIHSEPANNDRKTHSSTSIAQRFDVEPNTTYTLSADIKTANMKASQAFLDVWFIKSDNQTGDGWRNNRETAIQGNSDWVRRQVTFTTTKETRRIGIYLKNEQLANEAGSGDAWFDNVQLEKGSTHTGYNPVLNSGLEEATGLQEIQHFSLSGTKTNLQLSDEAFSGEQGFEMTRKSGTEGNGYIAQYVSLNQQKAEPITISALSKAKNVQAGDKSAAHQDYSLWADIIYQDGSKELRHEKFPTGNQDWNRAAIAVQPKQPIKEVKLLFMFRNQMTGTAYFDNLRIMEGSRLTESEYDVAGNYVVAQYDEELRKTSFTYDTFGNRLSETDEKGQQKNFQYDKDNQLVVTRLANGTEVKYTYDDNGNITKREIVANGIAQSHGYSYDADDKTTLYQDPLGRKISYEYDASGNEIGVNMPNGNQIKNEYDSADRQTKVLWGATPAYSFQYDPNGNQTKVTDHLNQVVTDKIYDDANRITKVQERGGTISYQYKDKPTKDNKGKTDKVADVTINKGAYSSKVSYEYNALDQNTSVSDGDNKYRFDYDEFGNKTLYTAGNGSMSNFSYDQTNKLTEVAIGTKNHIQVLKESYAYDATSNRTSIVHTDGKKTTYSYDSTNQLTKEVLPNGELRSYTYDGFGNRTSVTINNATHQATFNAGNQLISFNGQALTYDANGNRLSDEKYNYAWDQADRLVGVTKNGENQPFVTYTYDEDNRRLSKKVNGKITNYHYDGDSIDVLYETDTNGQVLCHYIYSDDNIRLAMKSGKNTVYYHYNGHGDVVALTDENGQQVASYTYDAWGNVLTSEAKTELAKSNPYGYAGYTYDAEIQQYYLMARYYHPAHGVFTSLDPDPGDEDDPLTMNGYTYADNNPVMNVDPDGHWVWFAVGAGFAAYDAYKTYKKTKSWKKAGWAAAKSAATSAAFGGAFKVLGRGLKFARSASNLRWSNVTKRGSSVKNIRVNKSVRSFGKALKKSGYKQTKTYSNGKRVVHYTKSNKRYVYRGKAKSGDHTYDYFSGIKNAKGKNKVIKIRVRRW
ncbi:DNRLRE domain-containing protein [Enterococcus sp. AZ012]|uniref:DNRLRE domain-containing protein n=1 Tax=unclassified Enterococcus TaxID=2608891 RepID=UPI003D2850BB